MKINITGCEDYENTFARIESDCTLRFGFKVPEFLKHLDTFQQVLRDHPVHVLVIFGNGGGLLFDHVFNSHNLST